MIWVGALPGTIALVEAVGIPVFSDIPQAMRALHATRELSRLQAQARAHRPALTQRSEPCTRAPGGAHISEWDGKQLLARQSAVSLPRGWLIQDRFAALPDDLPYPLVAKLQSPQLLHKSDAGGVVLKIQDKQALEAAVQRLFVVGGALDIPLQGVLIEQMLPFDHELLLGLRRDERFGPVLTLARGGVEAEADPDVVNLLLPASQTEIHRMLHRLRYARLLNGFRGKPAADLDAIAQRIFGLCEWFLEQPLRELEINPLALQGGNALALDALIAPAG